MSRRILTETSEAPPWLQLEPNEQILFCGHTTKEVWNPADQNKKHPETVVLTNRRLVNMCLVKIRGWPSLTTIPLHRIDAIQSTCVNWSPWTIMICILLFMAQGIPGIIFLVWMYQNYGVRVNVVAGNLRTEVKFSLSSHELYDKFVRALDTYTTVSR